MKEIKLFNRDGANLRLISEDETNWKFAVDDKHRYILQYCRFCYKNDNKNIDFIDPSGGPMLSCGQRISKEYVIDNILLNNDECIIQTKKSIS